MSRKRKRHEKKRAADPLTLVPGEIALMVYETVRLMVTEAPVPLGWADALDALADFAEAERLASLQAIPRAELGAMFVLAWASRAAILHLEQALLTAQNLPPVVLDPEFVRVVWCGVITHYQEACVRVATMLREHGWQGGRMQ
jgi:hypothetical protein